MRSSIFTPTLEKSATTFFGGEAIRGGDSFRSKKRTQSITKDPNLSETIATYPKLAETIPKESPHNLCDVLRWSIPSRPCSAPSTEHKANAVDCGSLDSGRLEANSFANLLKVIDTQLGQLKQTISRIKLCHESEMSQQRNTLQCRTLGHVMSGSSFGSVFQNCLPVHSAETKFRSDVEDKDSFPGKRARGAPVVPITRHQQMQSQAVLPASTSLASPSQAMSSYAPRAAAMELLERPESTARTLPESPPTGMGILVPASGEHSSPEAEDMYAEPVKDKAARSDVRQASIEGSDLNSISTTDGVAKFRASLKSEKTRVRQTWDSGAEEKRLRWSELPDYPEDVSDSAEVKGLAAKRFLPLSIKVAEVQREFEESTLPEMEAAQKERNQKRCQMKVLHPHSMKRLVWDLMGALLIFYDVIVIPLQILPIPTIALFTVMQWITLAFWTADIPRQFVIGYEVVGGAELRVRKIAIHYACTWMIPDLFVVLVDWFCIFIVTGANSGPSRSWRVAKSVKALRLLRLLRLARVAKIPGILAQLSDTIMSEYNIVRVKIALVLIVVSVFAHYGACYWYAAADFNVLDHETTWIEQYDMTDEDVSTVYLTAVQWAVARSGFGAIEVYPTNFTEHLFSVGVALLWLVVSCGTGSLFTIWLVSIRESNLKRIQDEAQVRLFLRQRRVSTQLSGQIMQFYRCFCKTHGRIHEQDLAFIAALPGDLQIKLHAQVYMPTLNKHPAFAHWFTQNSLGLQVCHLCITEQRFIPGDTIFEEGQTAEMMRYITHGLARYYLAPEEGELEPEGTAVPEGTWVSEACLWQHFRHLGRMIAVTSLTSTCLDVRNFCQVIERAQEQKIDCSFLYSYSSEVTGYFKDLEHSLGDLWDVDCIRNIVTSLARSTGVVARQSMMTLWNHLGVGSISVGRHSRGTEDVGPQASIH